MSLETDNLLIVGVCAKPFYVDWYSRQSCSRLHRCCLSDLIHRELLSWANVEYPSHFMWVLQDVRQFCTYCNGVTRICQFCGDRNEEQMNLAIDSVELAVDESWYSKASLKWRLLKGLCWTPPWVLRCGAEAEALSHALKLRWYHDIEHLRQHLCHMSCKKGWFHMTKKL
jgi:hypothetical protein